MLWFKNGVDTLQLHYALGQNADHAQSFNTKEIVLNKADLEVEIMKINWNTELNFRKTFYNVLRRRYFSCLPPRTKLYASQKHVLLLKG